MRNIVIAKEFSRTPFGRYTTDSPHSAERFRREFLVPALKGTEQEYSTGCWFLFLRRGVWRSHP